MDQPGKLHVPALLTLLFCGWLAMSCGGFVVLAPFGILGGPALAWVGWQEHLEYLEITERGIPCPGRVIEVYPFTDSDGDARQSVGYLYDCGDGPRAASYDEGRNSTRKVNQVLTIEALPEDPSTHRVQGDADEGLILGGLGAVFAVMSGLTCVLTVGVVAGLIWSIRTLIRHGQPRG